ncbi:SNF2 family N-terminal domain-containing protein [Xylaria sp. FL1042]|nr:SNF2 family N-terminal domain-containing protein [Xylaria sp. FL1042]
MEDVSSNTPTTHTSGDVPSADPSITTHHADSREVVAGGDDEYDDQYTLAALGDQEEQHHPSQPPLLPKKRPIDDEEDRQKKRKASNETNDDQANHDTVLPAAASMILTEMTREQLRQSILAMDENISISRAELDDVNGAARALGLNNSQGPDYKWSIEGMLWPLYPHQLVAVYFMLKRELSQDAPYGGLNADAMGLGKTVETLATMVMNPPDERDIQEGRKVTLWVSPKSSHSQISDAVRKFCCETKLPNVLIYDKVALTKTHGDNLDSFLQEQDIIIVNYESLIRDCQAELIAKRGPMKHMTPELFRAKYMDRFGPLMKIKYYRTILDEAHRIKNTETQMLRACSCLDTKYRWCLTGTPLLNFVSEISPYLLFLKVPEVKSQNYSFETLCEAHEGRTRLDGILNKVMIRRKIADTILGRQLIELPTDHHEVILVTQTREESIIYKWFAKQFRESFNGQLNVRKYREQKEDKERDFCIVNILRLRQMACDLSLIEYMMERPREFRRVQLMVRELSNQKGVNAFYDMISQWCQDQEQKLDSNCTDSTSTALVSQTPVRGAEGNTSTSEQDALKYFMRPSLSFESRYFAKTTGKSMILGSKMKAVKESIQKHLTDGPDDKLLIFNEFLYCANLVGRILDDLKIKHVYYSGSYSRDTRSEAIDAFRSDPDLKVMVLSMKCGCEALNLAFANRVITIEPWWNNGLEAQAFGRVYRFGQEKEVYHTRIISKKTIETPMVALQDAKEINIEMALEGRFSGEISSLEQTARLLGRVVRDDSGNIISVSDDDEDTDTD